MTNDHNLFSIMIFFSVIIHDILLYKSIVWYLLIKDEKSECNVAVPWRLYTDIMYLLQTLPVLC